MVYIYLHYKGHIFYVIHNDYYFLQMTQHDINFVAQFLTDNFDHFSVVCLFYHFLMLGNTIFTDLF